MNADVISDLLGDFAVEGWSGLSANPDRMAQQNAELVREALTEAEPIATLFASDAGKAVLKWLVRKTIMRPPSALETQASDPHAYALAKARREGQDAVVWMILSALQVARGEEAMGGDL